MATLRSYIVFTLVGSLISGAVAQESTSKNLAPTRWNNSALLNAGREAFPCEVETVFPDGTFASPVMTLPYLADGARWYLVLGRFGPIWSVPEGFEGGAPHRSFDLAEHLAAGGDPKKVGLTLMGAVFDREFPKRPYLYLRYSERGVTPAMNRLVRYEVTASVPLALGDGVEILSWESRGHDGGDLQWGPKDGMLYITAGDGSAPGDPDNIGQQTDMIRGAVLRIDVHRPANGRRYSIPADNPWPNTPGVRPELWCYGLRNPWRMCFHPERDEIWLGDNGDEHWELVHRIRRGANYGWSAYEGSHPFRASNPLRGPVRELTRPEVEHPHRVMRSVVGGQFYRGSAVPKLVDHYIYGCYFTKRIWAFSYRDGKVGEPFEVADAAGALVDIKVDHDGEILITCLDGRIVRLRAAREQPREKPWPGRLSETGLFSSVAEHALAPGVHPYLVNAESWADGARRERFLAIPEGERIKVGGGNKLPKSWDLPVGSAIGQTLSLEGRRIETQVLYFDGTWRGFTYRWAPDQSDASLVGLGRIEVDLPGSTEVPRKWVYVSRAECMTCHTQRSNFAISLTTMQLDRTGAHGRNQIDEWIAKGLLTPNANLRKFRGQARVDPSDESRDLEARARSYLDLNCAHCHRETGLGGRAGFQLLVGLPLEETGILNAKSVIGMMRGPEGRVVAPGEPGRSELLARMAHRGAGQMPLIGSQVVDREGVALIEKWIESLGRQPGKVQGEGTGKGTGKGKGKGKGKGTGKGKGGRERERE